MKRVCILLVCCLVLAMVPVKGRAAELDVAGKSALLMDMTTGTVLYEKNAHEPLAPASVTKVMTMLLVMEAIDSGKIGWNDPVTVSEAAAAKGGSQIYLKVGESMSVTDMLKSIAVSSANDAACAMAECIAGSESAFVDRMNERAAQLGMKDTLFANCTGLDDEADATKHHTSAHDIALMSRELMLHHPDITKFTTIWMDTVRDGTFGLANTNKLIRFYNGATGLKTGFTSSAGYCLAATAEREGLKLVAVVMGAESSQDRFAACKQMLDYGFANFALIEAKLNEKITVPVKLGKQTEVQALPAEHTQLLVDKGQKNQVQIRYSVEESVTAPVSKGQKLGTMTVTVGDQILAQVPLVASQGVERLRWSDVFVAVLKKLCMSKG